jgi:DNA ligase (NAD+)
MNIEGLSEATLEKFTGAGLVKELADLYHLGRHKDRIIEMEGFGEKSFTKLIEAVDRSRKTTAIRLLYGLGIPGIGLSNAKLICRNFKFDWNAIENAKFEQLIGISGIGDIMADAYVRFFSDEGTRAEVRAILPEVELEEVNMAADEQVLANKTFVITGSLTHFKNREELVALIEEKGGKVSGSVSAKTSYLINNDNTSNSTKNKKANELDISIITEEQFLEMIR